MIEQNRKMMYFSSIVSMEGVDESPSVIAEAEAESELAEVPQALKPPPLCRVVLLNDDFTPMDFVVGILQTFFSMGLAEATRLTLQVHQQGKAVCGVFPRDIAETKAYQVNEYARHQEYPLLAKVEVNVC